MSNATTTTRPPAKLRADSITAGQYLEIAQREYPNLGFYDSESDPTGGTIYLTTNTNEYEIEHTSADPLLIAEAIMMAV